MASANVTKEAIWLCTLLADLGFPQSTTTIIHADNQGCIALAKNPVAHSQAKHIDIHHHFLCECITSGEIMFKYCPMTQMIVDILTKPLPHDLFEQFHTAVRVIE